METRWTCRGMQFDRGYLSPYFVTDASGWRRCSTTPTSSSTKRALAHAGAAAVLEQVVKADKPLLIIAEDLDGDALATLVVNKLRGSSTSAR